MSVEVTHDGVIVVSVSDEIDFSNVGPVADAVESAVERSPKGFILDLSRATYLDSAGIAVTIMAYQRLCPEGKLVLVIANRNIRELISLIHPEHLPGMFICEDLPSAQGMFADQ